MIFIDNIKKNIALEIHCQIFLPDNLKDKRDKIIKFFLLVLKAKTKSN